MQKKQIRRILENESRLHLCVKYKKSKGNKSFWVVNRMNDITTFLDIARNMYRKLQIVTIKLEIIDVQKSLKPMQIVL